MRYCRGRPGEWVRLKAPLKPDSSFTTAASCWTPKLYNRFEPLVEDEAEQDTPFTDNSFPANLEIEEEYALVIARPAPEPGIAKARFPIIDHVAIKWAA